MDNQNEMIHQQGHGNNFTQETDNARNIYETNMRQEEPAKKKGIYIGFYGRLAIFVALTILLIIEGVFFIVQSISLGHEKTVYYRETSNLDYQICLNENDFYEQECLGKDMLYVANLINKINVNFNYNFKIDNEVNLDFDYKIVGDLVIADKTGSNTYFTKEYILKSAQTNTIQNSKNYNLQEKVSIDYAYFNKQANDFKASYGLDTTSYLKVALKMTKKNRSDDDIEIGGNKDMSITIPLSERSVQIKMDYENINDSNQILVKSKINVADRTKFVVGVLLLAASIFTIVKIVKLLLLLKKKQSSYDKYIKKLLNEYDRLIVETTTFPNYQDVNVIKISKFVELLDVRDNLKQPIMYYNVTNHQKGYFYIKHNNELYLLTIKAVDLGEV